MKKLIIFAVCLHGLLARHAVNSARAEIPINNGYPAPLLAGDYVVFHARAFGPDRYVVLDFERKEARIYSPYRKEGLLHIHRMTDAQYDNVVTLLRADQTRRIPERNNRLASDAFEFSARGIVQGRVLKFRHILPGNKAVLALYELYKDFRDTSPKQTE